MRRKDFGLHNGWFFIDLAFIVLHEHDIFEGLAEQMFVLFSFTYA